MHRKESMENSNGESMYFFEYVKEIVALKSNKKDFNCSFGGRLAGCGEEAFEKCAIQAEVYVISDRDVRNKIEAAKRSGKCKRFHYFGYDADSGVLFYDRKAARFLNVCFWMQLSKKRVCLYVGKTYDRLVRIRISNLHPANEIVSDILEMLLLRNGYATVYCSAAYAQKTDRALLMFSAPRTGKTRTCMTLCEKHGFGYVAEDFAVTDGKTVYGAPWTGSFRNYDGNNSARQGDSKGAQWLSRLSHVSSMKATDMVILEAAAENRMTRAADAEDFADKLLSLQRYAIHYYWSPTVTVLGYFDPQYRQDSLMERDRSMIRELCRHAECWNLSISGNAEFADFIVQEMQNEKK